MPLAIPSESLLYPNDPDMSWVNGKVRARVTVEADLSEDDLKARVLSDAAVKSYTDGKTIRKVVVAKGPLVSVVVA